MKCVVINMSLYAYSLN